MRIPRWIVLLLLVVLTLLLVGCTLPGPEQQAPACVIQFNPSIRYQTIEGWGGRIPEWIPNTPFERVAQQAVFDLGLNRFGLELLTIPVTRWKPGADESSVDPANFDLSAVDLYCERVILPLRALVTSRGERFVFYVALPWTTHPSVLYQDPEEYAKFALAVLERFRKRGVEVDYWVIKNEPDFKQPWTPASLGRFIAYVGARFEAAGFRTRFAAPEAMTATNVAPWISGIAGTPGARRFLGQITYHSYDYDASRGEQPPAVTRISIAQWAQKLGVSVAQTEQGSAGRDVTRWDGVNIEHGLDLAENVWADLTYANASAWEPHVFYNYAADGRKWVGSAFLNVNLDHADFTMPVHYWTLRQFTRFVRPGAVRVATSVGPGCAGLRAVGFVSPEGKPVIVAVNRGRSACKVEFDGLPAGSYSVTLTTQEKKGEEQAPIQVAPSSRGTFLLPPRAVATFCVKSSQA